MNVTQLLQAKNSGRPGSTVTTVQPGTTVMEAAKKLAAQRIGAVVVVGTDGVVAGILSERDIVRVLAQSGPGILEAPVGDVMTRHVVTCGLHATTDELMATMTRGRFRHLPVIDGDKRLVGIISIGDVVKNHVEEIKQEASTLRDYIATH